MTRARRCAAALAATFCPWRTGQAWRWHHGEPRVGQRSLGLAGGVGSSEYTEAGAKKVEDREVEGVGAGAEGEDEGGGARIEKFGRGVDLAGSEEEVEDEGSGKEEEGEEEEKAFGGRVFGGFGFL